jgi:hypothetical protein
MPRCPLEICFQAWSRSPFSGPSGQLLSQSVSLRGARPCPELGVKPTCRLNAGTSQLDPTVWTGRALQAESAEWQQLVLRFCIRPLVEQIAPGHHGYPRASDLILG